METEARLYVLLDRWVAEADAGRLLPVSELCRDCPELLGQAEQHIAVLKRFHVLARPCAATIDEGETESKTAAGEPRLDELLDPFPGRGGPKLARYQIVAQLGKGGMGIVYKARDTQLGREVALKIMRPDMAANPITSDRFFREAKALAAIRHDHVVEIYDYGETAGVRFITMPLLAGESLETRLVRQGQLNLTEVIRVGTELAEGLAAVHGKGLIHRDLKPSNVWLEAPSGRVKLLDFGLARDQGAKEGMSSPGSLVGTPAYMSPEQVNGLHLEPSTDLFSLGSVLYKAVTGQAAFAGGTLTPITAIVQKDPLPARAIRPSVPVELSDLIERLHRKNPADRPASAAEVAKDLRALAATFEAPTLDRQVSRPAGAPPPAPKRLRYAVAVALGLLVVPVFGIFGPRFRQDSAIDNSPPLPGDTTEPLRVRALEVLHLASHDARQTMPRRLLGTESFGATLGDDILVKAHLSREAYAYLIVFRPDGKDEVLYPQRASDVPERSDEPRYPSKERGKVYGLTEGAGLWLVALVASDRPLPAYAEWRKQHPGGPWAKSDGEPDVVWHDDGQWLEAMTPRGLRNRGGRGEKEATGTAPIVRTVDWLKEETGATVSTVAFTVEAKK